MKVFRQAGPMPQSQQPFRARPVFSTQKPLKAVPLVLPLLDRVLQAIALAISLTIALLLMLNPISKLWKQSLRGLIDWLSLKATLVTHGIHVGQTKFGAQLGISMDSPSPDRHTLIMQGLMCAGIFGLSWAVRSLPLRNGMRTLCILHLLGLLMIAGQGNVVPYTLLDHTRTVYGASLVWLLLTPSLLAAGFFLVERSWTNRLAASTLIIVFQIVALPIKLALHSALVALLSPTVIPLLFFAAGPVLDVLLLAALYSWVLTWPQLHLRN